MSARVSAVEYTSSKVRVMRGPCEAWRAPRYFLGGTLHVMGEKHGLRAFPR
ncbi:hypothetical protein Plhal304r1_c011g0043631 [Plasmopara halstedii]